MVMEEVKNTVKSPVKSSLDFGIYTIYDCVLQQFEPPLSVPISKLDDFMKTVVNDVNSKYFDHESDYIINKIGVFNSDTGEVESHFVERVSFLDRYIDKQKRNLQTVVQTMNFLPSGYFKMPLEQKQAIQDKIDSAISKYVEDYVLPDLDVNTVSQDMLRNLRIENEDLKRRLSEFEV